MTTLHHENDPFVVLSKHLTGSGSPPMFFGRYDVHVKEGTFLTGVISQAFGIRYDANTLLSSATQLMHRMIDSLGKLYGNSNHYVFPDNLICDDASNAFFPLFLALDRTKYNIHMGLEENGMDKLTRKFQWKSLPHVFAFIDASYTNDEVFLSEITNAVETRANVHLFMNITQAIADLQAGDYETKAVDVTRRIAQSIVKGPNKDNAICFVNKRNIVGLPGTIMFASEGFVDMITFVLPGSLYCASVPPRHSCDEVWTDLRQSVARWSEFSNGNPLLSRRE